MSVFKIYIGEGLSFFFELLLSFKCNITKNLAIQHMKSLRTFAYFSFKVKTIISMHKQYPLLRNHLEKRLVNLF